MIITIQGLEKYQHGLLTIYEYDTNSNGQILPVNMGPTVHSLQSNTWSGRIETKVEEVTISLLLVYPKGFSALFKSLDYFWELVLEQLIHDLTRVNVPGRVGLVMALKMQ